MARTTWRLSRGEEEVVAVEERQEAAAAGRQEEVGPWMAGAGTRRLRAAEAAAMVAGWQSQDWMWWSYLRQKKVASTGRRRFP